MNSFIGKSIDNKYDITELIASGGMGEIYLARQKGAGQIVAVKKLKSEYNQDRVAVKRFINEARLYGQVTHPNAVKLHDVLNVNGQICIIMEYVDGKTLTQYLKLGYVFSTRQIIDISLQIADALATFHKAGIIHRDLKPDNIMLIETVSRRFSVKILDFGIAKFNQEKGLTQQGMIIGTPEFMSPEQCYGLPVDHRADIYSFGILLFIMICGHPPFEAPNALALLNKQTSEPLPKMIRPDSSNVPLALEKIVRKCAMKQPDDRYQSFVNVIEDLTCLQEGRATSLDQSDALNEQNSPAQKDAIRLDNSEENRRNRNAFLIALFFAAVIGVVIFMLARKPNNAPEDITAQCQYDSKLEQPQTPINPPPTQPDTEPKTKETDEPALLESPASPAPKIQDPVDTPPPKTSGTNSGRSHGRRGNKPEPPFASPAPSPKYPAPSNPDGSPQPFPQNNETGGKASTAELFTSSEEQSSEPQEPTHPTATGILLIDMSDSNSSCEITIDGRDSDKDNNMYGWTPQEIELPYGKHKITCSSPTMPKQTKSIELSSAKPKIQIVFWEPEP